MRNALPMVLAALLLAAPLRAAETVSDPATGFAVTVPDGYRAVAAQRPGADATFHLDPVGDRPRRAGTSPSLCGTTFTRAPQNERLTQAQINALTTAPERMAQVRAPLERAFRIESMTGFDLAGATGVEVIGTPLEGPGAAGVRLMLSMLETPRGRMVLSCATLAEDTPAAYDVFRTLRAGIRAPG